MELRVRRVKTFKTNWRGQRRLVDTQNILECRDESHHWDRSWKRLPVVDEEQDE